MIKEGAARREAERIEWERKQQIWRTQEKERQRVCRIEESREQLSEIIAVCATAKTREDFFDDLARRAALQLEEEQLAVLERLQDARVLLGIPDVLERIASWRSAGNR